MNLTSQQATLLLQLELKRAIRSIGGNKFERC
jgi:hypothetical protein